MYNYVIIILSTIIKQISKQTFLTYKYMSNEE